VVSASEEAYLATPSRWCAWCGEPAAEPVVIADVVAYHEFCSKRRAVIVGEIERSTGATRGKATRGWDNR